MKIIAMIPARYNASRFNGKLMKLLGPKTVIRHTYENTVATGLFNEVWVVTDSTLIYNEIIDIGGKAIMSQHPHESGSDRIAEAIEHMDVDIVVNVQGDEPFVQFEPLAKLLDVFAGSSGLQVQVASIMEPLTDLHLLHNPNIVKVVTDLHGNSLLFSRSAIPYHRDTTETPTYYRHIGVYAFRKQALLNFTKWPATPMEKLEKLENLRFLEHGVPIKMVAVSYSGVGIDTPEDLERARKLL